MESDLDFGSMNQLGLDAMRGGINKLRKTLWARSFSRSLAECFAHSSLALLQGQDVYDAYKAVAPNPKKVLNVQVSAEDLISASQLCEKLMKIKHGDTLAIAYAGRMVDMKGPLDWLQVIHAAVEAGVKLEATWFGDGPLMPEMHKEIERLGLSRNVTLPGVLGHDEVIRRLQATDIFLFCHKTREVPPLSERGVGGRVSARGLWQRIPARSGGDDGGRRIHQTRRLEIAGVKHHLPRSKPCQARTIGRGSGGVRQEAGSRHRNAGAD